MSTILEVSQPIHRSSENQIWLYLDCYTLAVDNQTSYELSPVDSLRDDASSRYPPLDFLGYQKQDAANFIQGKIPVVHRKVRQIDVHGQTGEIPHEKVDCSTSF
jgi:hypothetical protein